MSLLLESITFGLVSAFIVLGLVGIIVPMVPGTLLIWMAILVYALVNGLSSIGGAGSFTVLTLIALVTGTADLWLPYITAAAGGASKRALILGTAGALVGTLLLPLIGTVIGYAFGILLGEYQNRGDWREAFRASVGGVAGWGIATAVQLGGGLLMLVIFAWQALTA